MTTGWLIVTLYGIGFVISFFIWLVMLGYEAGNIERAMRDGAGAEATVMSLLWPIMLLITVLKLFSFVVKWPLSIGAKMAEKDNLERIRNEG